MEAEQPSTASSGQSCQQLAGLAVQGMLWFKA